MFWNKSNAFRINIKQILGPLKRFIARKMRRLFNTQEHKEAFLAEEPITGLFLPILKDYEKQRLNLQNITQISNKHGFNVWRIHDTDDSSGRIYYLKNKMILFLTPPSHFLLGETLPFHLNVNRLSHWQSVQQTFWKSKSASRLHQIALRDRTPITTRYHVHEDNTPPLKCKLNRVIQLHPSADSISRVVTSGQGQPR